MLLQADARALPLADASVQCVVTSPPYWGLRDYGLPPSVWDGDPACDHVWGEDGHSAQRLRNGQGSNDPGLLRGERLAATELPTGACCSLCPAWRGVLGLEPTPELYVAHIVEVFREVKRVLRDDGVCWLNLGDAYYSTTATQGRNESRSALTTLSRHGGNGRSPALDAQISTSYARAVGGGLKPKDLVGIPWRVAFALQADGWYLRADVIWAKPNPMPESVTDRPTKAHEYLFLLSKQASYFYDGDAVREPIDAEYLRARWGGTLARVGPNGLDTIGRSHAIGQSFQAGANPAGRNRRSVWTIATEPYPEAHFATFPEALVVPCVLAGTSEAGACAVCGAPWDRVRERVSDGARGISVSVGSVKALALERGDDVRWRGDATRRGPGTTMSNAPSARVPSTISTGWRPTCAHADAPRVPCTVLDPFGGTATVGAVAERLGRRWVATDLKPEYLALARRRTAQRGLPFLATTNGHVAPRPVALAGVL